MFCLLVLNSDLDVVLLQQSTWILLLFGHLCVRAGWTTIAAISLLRKKRKKKKTVPSGR